MTIKEYPCFIARSAARLLLVVQLSLIPVVLKGQWLQKTNGMNGGRIGAIAANGSNLFAATYFNGVFRSTNSGSSWTAVNQTIGTGLSEGEDLLVVGSDVFLGAFGGVFRTSDNGTTWTQVASALRVKSIASSGTNMYCGGQNGMYRSTNGGTTWTQINNGLTTVSVARVLVSGSNIFAGTFGGGVFLSTDNGDSWTAVNTGLTNTTVRGLTAIGTTLFAGTSGGGIFKSTNNGTSWTEINTGITNKFIYDMATDGVNLYASANTVMYKSTNGGTNWTSISTGLPSSEMWDITIVGSDLYAGTEYGLYKSTNGGTSWAASHSGLYAIEVHALAINAGNLFAGTGIGGQGVYLSTNSGSTWSGAGSGLPTDITQALAVSGSNLYAGNYGVYVSSNNGTSWTGSSMGSSYVTALAVNGSTIFAGSGVGVYKSTDNGATWTAANSGLGELSVRALAVLGTTVFVGTNDGIYSSANNGVSWSSSSNGIPSGGALCFAVTGSKIFAGAGSKVYVSIDNGLNWTLASTGLPNYAVISLAASGTHVFAGTTGDPGDGVYYSPDDGASWSEENSGLGTNRVGALLIAGNSLFAGSRGQGVWSRPLSEFVSAPVAVTPSSVSATSFTASWNAAGGASGYFLDVSTNSGFSTFVTGYNNLAVGNVTSYNVANNLAAGTTYYYRVRTNSTIGTSSNSNTVTLTTVPPAPVAFDASAEGQTSFVANWNPSNGATGYYIDVSTSSAFTTFVSGFENHAVGNVTAFEVTGNILTGTTYYYRVRAANSAGTSSNSNTISLVTVPPYPEALPANAILQTSFRANWSASATAIGYYLDVSTSSTFASFVTGYNSLSVGNVTSYDVNTNLTVGTTYYYRVRAFNTSGASGYSATISLTTIPAAPVVFDATNISETSFDANWSPSAGATEYHLDVSTDGSFASFVPGFSNQSVGNVTTYTVNTGIAGGTLYYYRVRATNTSGTSVSSAVISFFTVPVAPATPGATSITQTSFQASWSFSPSATAFYLDVSSTETFSTFVSGYENLSVGNVTTYSVTGLDAGTSYYFRVRAVNASGTSANSITASLLTIPPDPVALEATSVSGNSFQANWTASKGAASYFLDVSTDNTFSTFVPGYNSSATGDVLSFSVGGNLTMNTTYYYRVRAGNTSMQSGNSNVIAVTTLNDITPPVVTDNTAGTIAPGSNILISVAIQDGESTITSATIDYRSIADGGNSVIDELDFGGSTYTTTIAAADVGELGIQYKISATSGGGTYTDTGYRTVRVNIPNNGLTVPYSSHGKEVSNYRIVATPLTPEGAATVASVFGDDLGAYDKTKWRMYRYDNGATTELTANSPIQAGKGYWLIVGTSGAALDTGPGTTIEATTDAPFEVDLKADWNQIGNPYNFNISWADVQAANPGLPGLRIFNGDFADGTTLNKMQGGFVKVTSARKLVFPVLKNPALQSGRVKESVAQLTNPISGNNWQVYFTLEQGGLHNAISGFGMNKEASAGFDPLDGFNMPRFFDTFLRLNHDKKEGNDFYSTDIVPPSGEHEWAFEVESSVDATPVTLRWDNSYFGSDGPELYLWDESLQRSVDMRRESSYVFQKSISSRFRVIYGSSAFVRERTSVRELVVHDAWPNPATDHLTVAFSVPEAHAGATVEISMNDMLGRNAWNHRAAFAGGYHEVRLARSEQSPGIYFLTVRDKVTKRLQRIVLK